MALFNNLSFNFGFFCGLNNQFIPPLPFCTPFNPFSFAPMPFIPMFNNPFSGYSVFNAQSTSNRSFYPIFSEIPNINFNFSIANYPENSTSHSLDNFWKNSNQNYFNNNFVFNYTQTPLFSRTKPASTEVVAPKTKTSESPAKKSSSTMTATTKASNSGRLHSIKISGKVKHDYTTLSKSAAEAKAKNDTNLEDLRETSKKYSGWQLKANSFNHDIPFAKKGVGKILQKASEMTGMKFIITSALGTGEGKTPHVVGNSYASHHNAENPKLDISLTVYDKNGKAVEMNAKEMANKLWATGLFSHILEEPATHHLDVQINPEKLQSLSTVA